MRALGWRHVSGNIYLAVCTYACFRTDLLYVCRYVCAHVSICIYICLCMLWYDHLVSIPKLCARMHPCEISAHISTQRSAHKHTQAYRYTCHTVCVVFCAHSQGSLFFLVLAPLRLASQPAPPRGPGRVWGCGNRKAEQWSAGLQWNTALARSTRGHSTLAWLGHLLLTACHRSTTLDPAEALGAPGQAPSSLPALDWH